MSEFIISIRLNKFLAQQGICSRRAADAAIEAGRVKVNGVLARQGQSIFPLTDRVEFDGKDIQVPANLSSYTYIMLNKPVQVVATVSDPQNRRTVLDLLPQKLKKNRLFPVGRLDYFSQGLLLLTNDGELTYRLTHPSWHLPKKYKVWVRGKVTSNILKIMNSEMRLAEGDLLAPTVTRCLQKEKEKTLLEMVLYQGVNRQIRRMCRDLDLTVLSLLRTAQGPLELGNLQIGQCRSLTGQEIADLYRATELSARYS